MQINKIITHSASAPGFCDVTKPETKEHAQKIITKAIIPVINVTRRTNGVVCNYSVLATELPELISKVNTEVATGDTSAYLYTDPITTPGEYRMATANAPEFVKMANVSNMELAS